MATNPCALVNFLANDYAQAIAAINRKFAALQRLSQMLEQIGDLSAFIPDISGLIPLDLINLDMYDSLVSACPFLNLPQNPVDENLQKLKTDVESGYNRLASKLSQHPWLRMDKMQEQLGKAQAKMNDTLDKGTGYMQCLQQACASAEQAVNYVAAISQTDFPKQLELYTKNFVNGTGQILTDAMKDKRDQVKNTVTQIKSLTNPPFAGAVAYTPGVTQTVRSPLIPQLPPSPPAVT